MKNERRKRMTLLSNNTNINEYNEFRNIMISATNIPIFIFIINISVTYSEIVDLVAD